MWLAAPSDRIGHLCASCESVLFHNVSRSYNCSKTKGFLHHRGTTYYPPIYRYENHSWEQLPAEEKAEGGAGETQDQRSQGGGYPPLYEHHSWVLRSEKKSYCQYRYRRSIQLWLSRRNILKMFLENIFSTKKIGASLKRSKNTVLAVLGFRVNFLKMV